MVALAAVQVGASRHEPDDSLRLIDPGRLMLLVTQGDQAADSAENFSRTSESLATEPESS